MNIAVLYTGRFPDRETIDSALTHLQPGHHLYCYDLAETGVEDEEWDRRLDEILAADRVIAV